MLQLKRGPRAAIEDPLLQLRSCLRHEDLMQPQINSLKEHPIYNKFMKKQIVILKTSLTLELSSLFSANTPVLTKRWELPRLSHPWQGRRDCKFLGSKNCFQFPKVKATVIRMLKTSIKKIDFYYSILTLAVKERKLITLKQVRVPSEIVVKIWLPVQENGFNPLVREDPLEKVMATHSRILAWESHGQRNLTGYSPWGLESGRT